MSEESSTNPQPTTGLTSIYGSYLRTATTDESAVTEPLSEERRKVLEYHLSLYAFDETANLLGKLSIEFQYLETEIRDAISFLINRSDEWIGKIVTGGMPFGSLVDLFSCLFDYRGAKDEATYEAFHKIESRCRECARKRNELVHSSWYPNLEGKKGAKTFVVTRRRQKMKVDSQHVAKADVLKIADEIKSCRNDLTNFWKSTFPDYEQFQAGEP